MVGKFDKLFSGIELELVVFVVGGVLVLGFLVFVFVELVVEVMNYVFLCWKWGWGSVINGCGLSLCGW